MKKLQYIAALVLLTISLPAVAQTKEYYYMATQYGKVCQTELPYRWRNKAYTESGTYWDTVKTTLPKDTVYTMKLSIGQPSTQLFSFRICDGESVQFHGKTYTQEGVDTIRLTSFAGCDSLLIVDVRVGFKTQTTQEVQICEGDAYTWHIPSTGRDTILTRQGYYYDSLKSQLSGCDSLLCLHLIVNKPQLYKDSVAMCEHELPYMWHEQALNATGIYYDTIHRANLCDSIVRLAFTVLPDQHEQTTITFCGDFGTRHNGGDLFYNDTVFIDTLRTAGDGCYRIVKTTYLAGHTYRYEEYQHRPEGYGPYTWRGQVYTNDGTHIQTKPGTIGCDSTWILHLMTDYTVHQDYTFCDGSGIYYKNRYITEPCHIIDSLHTVYGGDSVVIANFTHKKRYFFTYYDTICSNVPTPWPGHDHIVFSGPGTYYDNYVSVDGCDSSYVAYISGGQPSIIDTFVTISRYRQHDSLPFRWKDQYGTIHQFNSNTDYTESRGFTTSGCDSIYNLHFRIAEKWSLDTAYLCHGTTTKHGQTYTLPGDYEIWQYSPEATDFKDSVIYIHVEEARTIDVNYKDSIVVCKNETPVYWHSHVLGSSGDYTDILPAHQRGYCDSIVYLHLTVLPDYETIITESVCAGSTFDYKGRPLTPGVHYDSWHSEVTGCDSVIKIVVNEMPTYFQSETVYFIPGTTYIWHEKELTNAGTYLDTLPTIHGCDSIFHLNLIAKQTREFITDTAICSNQKPYRWRNKLIYDEGTFSDTLRHLDIDSIFTLHLQINDAYLVPVTINQCTGDTFLLGTRPIVKTGIYYDSLITQTGCDSIIQYIVNFHPTYFKSETKHMQGQPVEWRGHTYHNPGTYYDSRKNPLTNCDSTWCLTLIGDSTYAQFDTITQCEKYVWYGETLRYSGDYEHRMKSIYNMDSIEYLHLTIHPVKRDTTMVNLCQGKTYVKGDHIVTHTTTFNDTLFTVHNCDSISTTIVNFFNTYHFPVETVYLISGDSLFWHGDTITTSGLYTKNYPTALCGCDSTYRIQVLLADTFSYSESVTICQNDMPYSWHGRTLNEAGDYTQIYHTQHDADSIYYLHLSVALVYKDSTNASICPGEKIQFFDRQITQPGIYYETLTSSLHCDSVFILNVTKANQQIHHDTIHLCQGDKYMGSIFAEAGEYKYTSHRVGCDSTITHVIVSPKYFFEEKVVRNEGSTYIWKNHKNDIELSKDGIYYDSIPSVNGCDSIYKLYLSFNPKYDFVESVTICKNETPYIWHKKGQPWYLDSTNIYYDSLQTISGCDSVYCLKLTVNDAIVTDEVIDACEGEEVIIFGKTYTTSTIHYDTTYLLTCPQVIRTAINFHRKYYVKQTYLLSEGEPYQFFDITITTPGVYIHKGATQHGCDSIVELTVTACQQKATTIMNVSLCSGDSLQLGDTIITSGCRFTRTYISRSGCDSIVQYNIHENPTYHFVERGNFCENSSYLWTVGKTDTTITKEGRYDKHYKTVAGCDSVYTLFLTALPTYLHDTLIYRCPEEVPYIYKGAEYFDDRDFVDTFHTVSRCDSICITRFRINEHCSSMDLYTRCQGDMLIIDEQNIINDGEYRIPRDNDSIHRFKVFSYPTFDFITNLGTHCDSVSYKDVTYYAHGTADTIHQPLRWTTIHGCDSIEHLTMVLYKSAPKVEHTQIIYDYATVLFGGQLYYESGDYERNYHTIHGCDSTYLLHLKVIPTDSTGALHYQYCSSSKENIEVFGKLYHPTQDTIIYDTTAIPNVNMWIIKKAIVRVNYPFTITSLRTESEVCAQPILPINIIYTQNGSYPERYELDFLPNQLIVSPTHHEGLINGRNIIEIAVTGNEVCVNPGEYAYKLRLTTDGCSRSDTTIYNTLSVRYPSSILTSYWNNTVSLVNKEYNIGHWDFQPPYNWQITDATGTDKTGLINPNQNLSYLYSDLLTAGDRIYVSPMREGYNKAVISCEYIFYPSPSTDKVPILVLPTAVAKRGMVQIQAPTTGTYQLYTSTGESCQNGMVIDGTVSMQMPGVSGFYLLQITLQDGSSKTERLIVY